MQGGDRHLGRGGQGRAGQGLGGGDGEVATGTWGQQDVPPGPKAECRAQQPLQGRTGGALGAGSTSQPTLVPSPVPPQAPTIPRPHHGLTRGFLGSKLAKFQGIRESGGAVRSRTGQRAQQGTSSHCDRNKGTLTFNLFLQHCQVISYFRFQLIDFKNPGKKTLMY